jgi:N-glycosylase/DNA lyase
VPERFDLDLVVRSHGWFDLPPWQYDAGRRVLARPLRLGSGRTVRAEVEPGERRGWLALRVTAAGRIGAAEAAELRAQLAHALALDHDLGPFHARIAAVAAARATRPPVASGRGRGGPPDLAWAVARGAGRLLRSPSVYEDAVKTLCTTNCSWALTRAMAGKLVAELGEPAPGGGRTFPTAAAMAGRPERFYREVVRAGYRARALRALAEGAASGRLDVEGWRDPARPVGELAAEIRALDGFGPYATEHLLKLLGRFDHLALDSWTRAKLARLRGFRRVPSDRTIARWYAPFGPWAGLAMWLEVTADWHAGAPTWP